MKNKKLLKWHSWLGLISGIFILMMGISGSILVFHNEIDTAIEKEFLFVKNNSRKINIDKALASIQKKYPKWDTRIVRFDNPDEAIVFDLRKDHNTKRLKVFVHPDTGKILRTLNANTHFTRWLLKLHYSLHADAIGKTIIFVVGLIFLASLITGTLIYRKQIIKVLLFKVPLKTKNKRSFLSSIHRITGVWALLLNYILVITGIIISFTIVAATLKTPKKTDTPYITLSIVQTLDRLKDQHPDFHPDYIRIATTKDAPITFFGKFDRDSPFWSSFFNAIQIDNESGGIVNIKKTREQPASYKMLSMVHPLHFGEFGGIFSKIIYCFIGISGPTLSLTGFFILIYKKKKK